LNVTNFIPNRITSFLHVGCGETPRQNALLVGSYVVTGNWMFQFRHDCCLEKSKEPSNQEKRRRIFPLRISPLNRVLLTFGLDDQSNNDHSVLVPKKPSASFALKIEWQRDQVGICDAPKQHVSLSLSATEGDNIAYRRRQHR
jgi:hypothetical protein